MKQRFSSLDVKVIAHELNKALVSLRISNIYDLSSRIFLLKCAKPGSKAQLLVDSGFRCHLTNFSRTAASAPSQFVARLRKYLKSRRITNVAQIGTDRVIELTFSDGQYRLFLEFFAAGNIVLTDAELNVLALLRQVSEGDEDVDVKLGGKYVLEAKQNFHGIPEVTEERIKETLEKHAARIKAAQEAGGKKAKKSKDDLKKALSAGFSEFPPHLLEHVFVEAGLASDLKAEDVINKPDVLAKVLQAMKSAGEVFKNLESQDKGYIVAKIKPQKEDAPAAENSSRDNLLYDDFHPFRPAQYVDKPDIKILEFDGFNKTVDEFYSSIESQKLESKLTEREEAAKKKLDTAKQEHQKRLAGLQQVQEMHIRKAAAIEANVHRVEEAVAAVNGLVAQGMDWVDMAKLIENEQKRNNVVAQMIKLPLKLNENTVTVLLDEVDMEDSEDDEDKTDSESDSDDEKKPKKPAYTDKRLAIDIDLALSGYANARQYYDSKKTAAQKEQKTVAASEKALKSMQKKTEADLKKGLKTEKAVLRPSRRQFWFEKFLYFISSDGYLVLGGKDAQQNELLYRKYLSKGDIYVHADLHGASSVIVKNSPSTPDAPIPPSTLSQAGALSVCSSAAWDSKAVMAAWWVNSDQVSKTAPTGEYLTTGGFIIRGQKNFLPPSQLLLGFSVYWLISEESRVNHGKHRLARTESMFDGEAEALAADAKGLNIDDETDGAIRDVEDAADEGEQEIEDDIAAEETADETAGETADEAVRTDNEGASNPLQVNGHNTAEDDDIEDQQSEGELPETHHDNRDEPQIEIEEESPPHNEVDDAEEANEENDDTAEEADSEPETTTTSATSQTQTQTQSSKQPQSKRIPNTKAARRRAQKYAQQDDSDNALAMSLLGSTQAQSRRQAAEEAKSQRDAKLLADRERRKQQHQKAAQAEQARQTRLNAPDDDEAIQEDTELAAQERLEHLSLDRIVPHPEPNDELLAAIPIVAPFSALSRAKFRVKLQPGAMKKGKAVKEILGGWSGIPVKVIDEKNLDKERPWAREVELIKQLKAEECVGVIPVKGVRVVASGAGGAAAAKSAGKTSGRGGRGSKKR